MKVYKTAIKIQMLFKSYILSYNFNSLFGHRYNKFDYHWSKRIPQSKYLGSSCESVFEFCEI